MGALETSDILMRLLIVASAALDRDRGLALTSIEQTVETLGAMGVTEHLATPESTNHRQGQLAPWQVQRVLAYIRANVGAQIRNTELAAQARVSVGHFSRAFKATFDERPTAFVLKLKMAHAREIMLTTRRPLAQVALDCGMSDQAHFSRTFRRIVGLTPSLFRRQLSSTNSSLSTPEHAAAEPAHLQKESQRVTRLREPAGRDQALGQAV